MTLDLAAGSELAGYRIEAFLARGGMGVVYRATQLSLERDVALKLIAPELASQESFRERFLREARLAASLEHPHVLPVYEVGEVGGELFLALRYVEGEDLGSRLTRGPLSPESVRRVVSQLCSALAAAHARRLLHRDLKPENVLLLGAEGVEHAYLTDFGLAKRQAEHGQTKTGELLGSLEYLAPELIEGQEADERSDLYALGCLLYACLTGVPPFRREREAATLWAHLKEPVPAPSEIRPELGEAFDGILERALAKDPGQRFQSAADFAAALADDAPPLPRLRPSATTNLPRPLSSFLGRERELDEVLELLVREDGRLLTLTGPGGTGKTRLAQRAAEEAASAFPDGIYWVGLASLRDPALVMETIAQTLEARDGPAEHIGERKLLLLLDNLEQVIEAAPELSSLLQACPNLTLLVTSRELLRVQGEREYPVPPLAQPEAVALFCERSRLEPTDEIAVLCARLDNLPLAVELAAARTTAVTPKQILMRLSPRLDLFKGGRDADPRQQTLRATIEWSHDLLSPSEQQLFARLSVFAGGCTLEAAEEVAEADVDTLQSLVEKSLLRFTNGRYWMLETIREYAAALHSDLDEVRDLWSRHIPYFTSLAENALEDGNRDGEDSEESMILEEANFRAALSFGHEGGGMEFERLRDALTRFWSEHRRALFDTWSADYDPVAENEFPFGDYERVLDRIVERAAELAPERVLELGIGTGNLTRKLLDRLPNVAVVGIDFSTAMLERAADAAPGVELLAHDLNELPLPPQARDCDVAVMSYVLHEFDDEHKLRLLASLLSDTLRAGGACVVGDVCFPNKSAREAARALVGAKWDPTEHYMATDELSVAAPKWGLRLEVEQVGSHAGVLFAKTLPSV